MEETDTDLLTQLFITCCQVGEHSQLVQVRRIISSEQLAHLQSTSTDLLLQTCRQICSEQGALVQIMRAARQQKQSVRSEHIRKNEGHLVGVEKILDLRNRLEE